MSAGFKLTALSQAAWIPVSCSSVCVCVYVCVCLIVGILSSCRPMHVAHGSGLGTTLLIKSESKIKLALEGGGRGGGGERGSIPKNTRDVQNFFFHPPDYSVSFFFLW